MTEDTGIFEKGLTAMEGMYVCAAYAYSVDSYKGFA
jgi:hypothetical protein